MVERGNRLGERFDTLSRRRAGDVDVLLDRHRDAVERSHFASASERSIRFVRGRERFLGKDPGDGVEFAVHRLDAVEMA
jgi:hypothetical protein